MTDLSQTPNLGLYPTGQGDPNVHYESDAWALEKNVPLYDSDESTYEPHANQLFVRTDGVILVGDGSAWGGAPFDDFSDLDSRITTLNNDFDGHALGGSAHSSDTLANLNSKVSDATLDDTNDARPPEAHNLAGSAHNSDTLANLNSKVSDATLDDAGDARPPQSHSLGGSAHDSDTLADLNSKISDASIDDQSNSRPPESHGNGSHSSDFTYSTTHSDVDIQIDEANGIINFVTN